MKIYHILGLVIFLILLVALLIQFIPKTAESTHGLGTCEVKIKTVVDKEDVYFYQPVQLSCESDSECEDKLKEKGVSDRDLFLMKTRCSVVEEKE